MDYSSGLETDQDLLHYIFKYNRRSTFRTGKAYDIVLEENGTLTFNNTGLLFLGIS